MPADGSLPGSPRPAKLVAGQRVQTAALTVAFEQGRVVRIEEEARKLDSPLVAHLAQQVLQPVCLGRQVAHVDADSQLVILALHRHDQLGQQVDRQVVHAVVPEILEHPQGHRLAGARTTAYYY